MQDRQRSLQIQQTVTGLVLIAWKVALALVAWVPIATTIAVYLLARFTSVLDAFAGEWAKLLAQSHNFFVFLAF